jgi:hypothetical protein
MFRKDTTRVVPLLVDAKDFIILLLLPEWFVHSLSVNSSTSSTEGCARAQSSFGQLRRQPTSYNYCVATKQSERMAALQLQHGNRNFERIEERFGWRGISQTTPVATFEACVWPAVSQRCDAFLRDADVHSNVKMKPVQTPRQLFPSQLVESLLLPRQIDLFPFVPRCLSCLLLPPPPRCKNNTFLPSCDDQQSTSCHLLNLTTPVTTYLLCDRRLCTHFSHRRIHNPSMESR